MKLSLKKGLGFGSTSGIITTLGLIVGLSSGTHLKSAVIGGILIIAIADSLSDAFGIHISEEAENKHTHREVWLSTLATLLSKFIFASLFIIPVLLFDLNIAVIVSIIWALFVIGLISYYLAKQQQKSFFKVITEHLSITILVIVLTHFVGRFISSVFG